MRTHSSARVKPFDFSTLAAEVRDTANRRHLEADANRFLKECGFRTDGRSMTERDHSVRLVVHSNGPRH